MNLRTPITATLIGIVAALALAGCDGGSGTQPFARCGNGIVDHGEACDDGNTFDCDACTSNCKTARCGDGFVDIGTETCDGNNFNVSTTCTGSTANVLSTCADLGFENTSAGPGGGLRCTAACQIDTSGCGTPFTPMPTAPPTATPSLTWTPDGASPTPEASPTPTVPSTCGNGVLDFGETCDDGNNDDGDACPANCIIRPCENPGGGRLVAVDFTPPFGVDASSVTFRVRYPDGAVGLPGSGTDASVRQRVSGTPPNAIVSVNDLDFALRSVITVARALPRGRIALINFDECAGATPPPEAFSCVVEGCATSFGDIEGCTCALEVEPRATPTPTPTDDGGPTRTATQTTTLTRTPTQTLTPTRTGTATSTPTGPTATPTLTQTPGLCGNGTVDFEAGETCDDGNTEDGDACPADCIIRPCTPSGATIDVEVDFQPPAGVDVAGITVFLRYPDGRVRIPGLTNQPQVQERIVFQPDNTFVTPNDLDYALRAVVFEPASLPIEPPRLLTVQFDLCADADQPGAADFRCVVEDASAPDFQTVEGVTCIVRAPEPPPTRTPTHTLAVAFTPTQTASATRTPTVTGTATRTSTPSPTATHSATPVPPTATAIPPTATPVPPTATPVPPTATPSATPTPTFTPTATDTPAPTATSTTTPTETATSSATPTQTAVPPTATVTLTPTDTPAPAATPTPTVTQIAGLCGNGIIDFETGETCDDGNSDEGDACPADCIIRPCTPSGATMDVDVDFQPPAGADVAGITVFLRYPDGRVRIPGSANQPQVQERIVFQPDNTFVTPNDLDYALRVVVFDPASLPIAPPRLLTVTFDLCAGADQPGDADFRCLVEDASAPDLQTVEGVTCTVRAPEPPPAPTPTLTPSVAFTPTQTPSASHTPTGTGTATRTSAPSATITHSATPLPPTATAIPPSPTPVPPTATPVPPTATPTATRTASFTPTVTNTPAPTATPTPTATATATQTEVASTPTPTPTPDSVCGDGLLSGSETCESCPGDCTIGPCTVPSPAPTVTFRVNWSPPFGVDASSTTVLVAYRSTLVSLPGSGSAPASRVTLRPANAIVSVNDLDYALRVVVTRSAAITPGRLFHVNFDRCSGAAAPVVSDFTCTVQGCASSFGDVDACTCQVVTP